ncbi:Rad52/Rad22 family DNA repair protein [Hyphomonas sp.]|uniref:Rad52/Rad22 family DNA repair protein n=2 Tax=Pseudomonadota TaxID=1224 RepID=UPI00326327DD
MMGFSDKQVRALSRGVPARAVRSRLRAGRELSYIEGWYVISQANRIFGFDGWDRETIETKCLLAREARGTATTIYAARVRITVRTEESVIVRDGHGTGEAHGDSAGEVHDRALKAAETDATKRALATFGKAFGLELYAGGRRTTRPVVRDEPEVATTKLANANPVVENPADRCDGAKPHDDGPEQAAPPAERTAPVEPEVVAKAATRDLGRAVELGNRSGSGAIVAPPFENRAGSNPSVPTNGGSARGRIEKAALTFPEPHRIRDKDHLRFVASQPCLLCSTTPSDAHHVRFAQPRAMSRKVGDDFTVPLCRKHHRDLHHCGNEAAFWHDMGIDPLQMAKELWEEAGKLRTGIPAKRKKF